MAAVRRLRELSYRNDVNLSPDQVLQLLRDATGSETIAQEKASEFAHALLLAKAEAEVNRRE